MRTRRHIFSDHELASLVARDRMPGSRPEGHRHYAVLSYEGHTYNVFAKDRSHAIRLVQNFIMRLDRGHRHPATLPSHVGIASCRLVKDDA